MGAGGPWPTVRKLIELFTMMGCEVRDLPGALTDEDGTWKVRFLYNPEVDDFQSLGDLADDERIPWSEVEAWERRLQIEVPRPHNCH